MNTLNHPNKYYNFSECYNEYEKASNTNDIQQIQKYIKKNTNLKENTSLNYICIALAKNKLLELIISKQHEIIEKHDRDIYLLKKEIEELKKN
jgi:hypothetical protein